MKKITESIWKLFQEQGEAYVRMLREYSTVAAEKPEAKEKALKYISDMKNLVYETAMQLIDSEKKAVAVSKQNKAKEPKDTNEALLFAMNRLTAIEMMKSEIAGSTDYKELIDKYRDSEYLEEFKVLFQPVIKNMIDRNDPGRMNLETYMATAFNREPREIEELTKLAENVQSILFFNQKAMPLGVMPNDNEEFLIGNYQSRNIAKDIDAASPEFNPLDQKLEPILISEKAGNYQYKTIKYQYEW